MSATKILFYFKQHKFAEGLAIKPNPRKAKTYQFLFDAAKKQGVEIYFGSQEKSYLNGHTFIHTLLYKEGGFVYVSEPVTIDIIFDRSSVQNIIPESLHDILFNTLSFKRLCSDKNLTHQLLHEYMPKSFALQSKDDYQNALLHINHLNRIVLKPALGLKGLDIVIDNPKNITRPDISTEKPYVLQQFIDTSQGIPNITKTLHDVRAIMLNDRIVLTSLRTPPEGSLLANVAQGGSIREIDANLLPKKAIDMIHNINAIVRKDFGDAFYSIDFGIDADGTPYLFELNDRIDVPDGSMNTSQTFAEELPTALLSSTKK